MKHKIILEDREYMLIHFLIKNELILSDVTILSLAKDNKQDAIINTRKDKLELKKLAKKFEMKEINLCQPKKKKSSII